MSLGGQPASQNSIPTLSESTAPAQDKGSSIAPTRELTLVYGMVTECLTFCIPELLVFSADLIQFLVFDNSNCLLK